jgi:ATP-dependent Clp protease adapter protein ClpS
MSTLRLLSKQTPRRGRVPLRAPIIRNGFLMAGAPAPAPPPPVRSKAPETVLKLRFEPLFRVILHYSQWSFDDTREIAKKVKTSVPILSLRDCEKIVKNAQSSGTGVACVVMYDKAMLYCDNLTNMGLRASIEEA